MLRSLILLGATLMAVSPANADEITKRLAAAIEANLPGSTVTVPDPYGVDITYLGEVRSLGIGSVRSTCVSGEYICIQAIEDYALKATHYMLGEVPLSRDSLKGFVRSKQYVASVRAAAADNPELIIENISDELELVCYQDLPRGRRPLVQSDLTALNLKASEAIKLCESNASKSLSPLSQKWKPLPENGIGVLDGSDEVANYLLNLDAWLPLALNLGNLVIAVPSADTVLYAKGDSPIAIDAVATLAEKIKAQASMPVSSQVFRWTDKAWVCVWPKCERAKP